MRLYCVIYCSLKAMRVTATSWNFCKNHPTLVAKLWKKPRHFVYLTLNYKNYQLKRTNPIIRIPALQFDLSTFEKINKHVAGKKNKVRRTSFLEVGENALLLGAAQKSCFSHRKKFFWLSKKIMVTNKGLYISYLFTLFSPPSNFSPPHPIFLD